MRQKWFWATGAIVLSGVEDPGSVQTASAADLVDTGLWVLLAWSGNTASGTYVDDSTDQALIRILTDGLSSTVVADTRIADPDSEVSISPTADATDPERTITGTFTAVASDDGGVTSSVSVTDGFFKTRRSLP